MPVIREVNENKVAHAMATHSRLVFDASGTSPWRHKIKIKDLFVSEITHEAIDALCERAARELKMVIESEGHHRDHKDDNERTYAVQQLENAQVNFDMLIGAGDDTVEEREQNFNYCLSELYDIGDIMIELRDGKLQKFLWIG